MKIESNPFADYAIADGGLHHAQEFTSAESGAWRGFSSDPGARYFFRVVARKSTVSFHASAASAAR
jgi:hypothetical protein